MKKIATLSLSILLSGCGMMPGAKNTPANNSAPAANAASSGAPANTNAANSNANANAAKPAPAGPKRIEFKKGEYSGTESVTLAPGETATFVVGAANDQKLYIESSDKGAMIKITGGKVAELSNEKGYFDGITTAKGDITFTLSNPGKSEMKTKLSVTLVENGD